MGWGRMLLLGNLGQQLDIEDQRRELQELRSRMRCESHGGVRDIEQRLANLERQGDEMKLYLAGLGTLPGRQGPDQPARVRETR